MSRLPHEGSMIGVQCQLVIWAPCGSEEGADGLGASGGMGGCP